MSDAKDLKKVQKCNDELVEKLSKALNNQNDDRPLYNLVKFITQEINFRT